MREFLYEADKATDIVKKMVDNHCKKYNLPVRYGFAGLEFDEGQDFGHIPYVCVRGDFIKIAHFKWHKDRSLAKILDSQGELSKIQCC